MTEEPEGGWRNLYGRRIGKTLKPHQRQWLSLDLEPLIPKGVRHAENRARTAINPASIFGDDRPLWLEIGFGGGEHLVHMAALHPEVGLVGCEPFINGVAILLGKMRAAGLENLSIYPGDVRDLFDVLPDASLSRAFLNYPDPWPKRRHHQRRFVTRGYLADLARVLIAGAEFRVATDIPDYVRQTLQEVPQAGFQLVSQGGIAWDDWITTRYEAKALREGRTPHYMTFRRIG